LVVVGDIDKAILQVCKDRRRKVAFVIAALHHRLGFEVETVALRLYALVEDGTLRAFGDVTNWQFSEVEFSGGIASEAGQ
jgi:DNA-binding Lrp family transcriptional regulator